MSDVVRMRDVVVIGGGCYGTFYADALVADAGTGPEPASVLVGTISSCHGALNLLTIGAVSHEPLAVG